MFIGAFVAIAALVGCNETYEVSGRQVRVEADVGLEMCAGTLEHMDRFVERFAAELGLPLTGEPWIDFRWMTPRHLAERNPCGGMPACAVIRTVYASEIPHEHELVHSAASDLGLAHPFFIEGLAMAFEGGTRDSRRTDGEPTESTGGDDGETGDEDTGETGDDDEPPPRVLSVLRDDYAWLPGKYYVIAGAFTRYLIDRFGLRLHLEFYRRTWWGDSYAALDREFSAVFGVTLADAVTDFEAEQADCPFAGYRFKLLECEAPELEWDGERLARYFEIDCDDAATIGQRGETARIVHTLEVPQDGHYRLELRGSSETRVTLGSCGGCERRKIARANAYTDLQEIELPAGRYFLRAETGSAEPVRFGVVLERAPE